MPLNWTVTSKSLLKVFGKYIPHTICIYSVFCSLSVHIKVCNLKETHSIYIPIAVAEKKRYTCSGIVLKNNTVLVPAIFHSFSIINKVSLACLMVPGDSPTRVHLCASSCHQERSYFPIPTSTSFWCCTLGGWSWKLRSRDRHWRDCLFGCR